MKLALFGNQNSGKTSLFNALTGSNQKVGNWPGVTIDRIEGYIKKNNSTIVDLPGVYSLSPYTSEEEISRRFVLDQKVDLIINSGISGGTKPLKRRDSILATYLYYSDVDATIFGYAYGQVPGMPVEYAIKEELIEKVEQAFKKLNFPYVKTKVVTGDQFITSMDQLKNCREKDNIATDMEGAAIAQAAYNARVDLIILKYVSDVIGDENQTEEYYKFETEMAHRSAAVTLEFLKILD